MQTSTAAAFQHAALPLASQLLFSSTSAVWSQTGFAHYAAANSYLDGHAADSQQAGLPGTALQYGPFGEAGMAATHVDSLAAVGLKSLKPQQVSPAVDDNWFLFCLNCLTGTALLTLWLTNDMFRIHVADS